MTANDMIRKMIDQDIEDIRRELYDKKYYFLIDILGHGWKGYYNLEKEAIKKEYKARFGEECDE